MFQQKLYDELSYYTLSHPDPAFIHQNIVDAFAAQTANKKTKPIKITFALIGLYLSLEKGYTGKEVQNAHVQLAKKNKIWPTFILPEQRGNITVADVLAIPPGTERDEKIKEWCRAVWAEYTESHKEIARLVETYLYR